MNLVKFLAIGYKINKRPLNPLAAPWVHNLDTTEENKIEKEIIGNIEEE